MKRWWNYTPWRMIQTNMRQIDLIDLDAEEYVKQLKEFSATIAMISIGGIQANYPSKVPDHTINELCSGDSIQTLIDTCHRENIKVIARLDFSKIHRSVYDRHPDWAYRTSAGEIVDYNGNIHTCICGGFQQEKAFEIMEEVLRLFPIDGTFINMGGFQTSDYSYNYHGICHCENCQKKFHQMFGLELPTEEDMHDPVYRKYKIFQKRIITDFKHRMEQLIHNTNPNIAVEGFDFRRLESSTEYKKVPFWQYCSSSTVRGMQSLPNGMPCSNPSVDFIGYFYRHNAVSSAMQGLRLSQTLANYGLLDYYIMGMLNNHEDQSGFHEIKQIYQFHQKFADRYKNMHLHASVLLVRLGGYSASSEGKGWVRVLTESHILFHETEPDFLTDDTDLSAYQAVIVADVIVLSSAQATLLDSYVKHGGTLIVSGNTGQYDQNGDTYPNYPLQSLGISKLQHTRNDMRSSILHVENNDKKFFYEPLHSNVFYIGDDYIEASYQKSVEKYLSLIPPHKYGPPELCYYTEISNLPGVTVQKYQDGKGIFIPWHPGLLYFRDGYENTFHFLKCVLTQLADLSSVEEKPFTPMVEVTYGSDENKTHSLVHLINGTGHFGTSFFKPIPVTGIPLRLKVPKSPIKLFSLTTQTSLPFSYKNGTLSFSTDVTGQFEAIDIIY